MRPMKTLGAAALLALLFVPVANATTYEFNFTSSDITASGSLDVSGGQAVSGTGTISWTNPSGGPETLTLLTLSNPLAQDLGGGQLNGVFDGGNANGDTVFPIDGLGLVFIVGTPGANSSATHIYAPGFNIWYNGSGYSYTLYDTNPYKIQGGTADLSVQSGNVGNAPLPAALPLFATGLGALGVLSWRKKKKTQVA